MSDSPFRPRGPIDDAVALRVLSDTEIEVLGRMPWSSNATFLVDLLDPECALQGIYKPLRGERPLWDFPPGLYKREAAAYELSRALGWGLVPPTVVRDGPLGVGSVQLFVPSEFDEHYYTLLETDEHHLTLQRLCVFDVIANATDRKGGHCLLGEDGRVYAIDNGLSFHVDFKLRTVIWDWAGEPIPVDIVDDVCRFLERGVPDAVASALDEDECAALVARARHVAEERRFPIDPTGRRYPWPLV